MKPSRLIVLGVLALSAAIAGCSANNRSANREAAQPRGYERGQIVTITGVASDFYNQGLGELEVVFEASRKSFDYLRLRKRRPVVRKVSTITSADGAFELRWPWDKGFNRFALVFGVTVAEPGGEGFHVLHREDLTRRIEFGTPVVASIRIEDTSFLDSFLEFRDGLETEAQRKVYREAGKPDKVRVRVSAAAKETDWWYFELGKVYRFRDGELSEVENFEPVRPFDS